MKENEKEIFIDAMADLGDEWTIEELKGTSYEKMSLERAIRERKSALGKTVSYTHLTLPTIA